MSHLSGIQINSRPTDAADKFVVITRKDIYSSDNRIDLLKLKLRNEQFMEINGLVDTRFNEIKPYVYEKPKIPFHEGDVNNENESREDVEPTTAKSMVMVPAILPEKLEDFGYSYDRPLNPMELPDRPIQLTTSEPYDDLPGASARIVGKRAVLEYW